MRPYHPRGGAAAPALSNINAETIRRAEEAVGKLADEYRGWVRADLEKLRASMASAAAGGDARTAAYKEVRHIAHDLRGQGATFGYPLITRIAASISHILKERTPEAESDTLLNAHFDALTRVVEDNVADAGGAEAMAIIATLEAVTGRALA
jgi:HPt (histidine-containing phosphotransfer) domain-containing protein